MIIDKPSSRVGQALNWSDLTGEIPVLAVLSSFAALTREFSAKLIATESDPSKQQTIRSAFDSYVAHIESEL